MEFGDNRFRTSFHARPHDESPAIRLLTLRHSGLSPNTSKFTVTVGVYMVYGRMGVNRMGVNHGSHLYISMGASSSS